MTDYPLVIAKLTEEDGGGFVGYFPDLPGCMSDGDSPVEATMNAQDALAAWMQTQIARGAAIPAPGSSSQRLEEREKALIAAMKSMLEFTEYAEDRIPRLESALQKALTLISQNWQNNPTLLTYATISHRTLLAKH